MYLKVGRYMCNAILSDMIYKVTCNNEFLEKISFLPPWWSLSGHLRDLLYTDRNCVQICYIYLYMVLHVKGIVEKILPICYQSINDDHIIKLSKITYHLLGLNNHWVIKIQIIFTWSLISQWCQQLGYG